MLPLRLFWSNFADGYKGMMLKRLIFIILLTLAFGIQPIIAQTRYAWRESVVTNASTLVNTPRADEGIEVFTRSGALIVRNQERTTVTVLTILGQAISTTTLNAGTHELRIGTHGIYLVKIGANTIRVAL